MTDDVDTRRDLEAELGEAVEHATSGTWRAARIVQERGLLRVSLAPSGVTLEIRKATDEARAYRRVGGCSFAYRSEGTLSKPVLASLDQVIAALAAVLDKSGFDLDHDILPTLESRDVGFPTPYHYAHLDEQLALPQSVIEQYRRDGHVLVRRAINPDVVRAAVPMISSVLARNWPHGERTVEAMPDLYSQGFTQITNLGASDPLLRVFSNMRRIARMAAELMGVAAVRLFCEDWLIKEPGAGITPWHQDAGAFPFQAEASITAWIPLRDIAEGEGLLRFVRASQALGLLGIEGLNEAGQAAYEAITAAHGLELDDLPPVFVGDVSFHDGRMIHGAFPNLGTEHRAALALHCYADGAVIDDPLTPQMRHLLESSAPHLRAGDPAAADAWPLLCGREAVGPPRVSLVGIDARARRLQAIVLPQAQPCAITIERGLLQIERLDELDRDQPTIYVLSGLVESHGHISYPHVPQDPVAELPWMNSRRLDYAETGVTTIRDMGATDDAICKLADVPGLPRVYASGTMILRNGDWPFTRTEPDELVRACVERIERGAWWVKVFADFTDDYRGRIDPGFTESDAITYPLERLREAVAAVHERGGRVAAHCFTHAGTRIAVEAGVDSLEHGWGVDAQLLERMLEQGTAWAPLCGITRAMWEVAARDGHDDRLAWLRRAIAQLADMLPRAEARGVTLLAGTDRFPGLTVADEIRQLHALGVSRAGALAAGSWSARAYLREPPLRTGAPADLVMYARDPRVDLAVLDEPQLILIGGKQVEPATGQRRPSFEPFLPPP